jgi:hypothetical protein
MIARNQFRLAVIEPDVLCDAMDHRLKPSTLKLISGEEEAVSSAAGVQDRAARDELG